MSDIVERLRSMIERVGAIELRCVLGDAAEEIEILHTRNSALRAELVRRDNAAAEIEQLRKENKELYDERHLFAKEIAQLRDRIKT